MNEIEKIRNTDIMDNYFKSDNIVNDVQGIIEASQKSAYRAVDTILLKRNWLIGYRIAEETLLGEERAEFLGLSSNSSFTETELETCIISNIQSFLMELGKGYAFVARQQHIKTEKEDYFIDLVFYNYLMKCFVLVDLKTGKITHQDVGQMDMYVRMYDELKKSSDDNPTLGVVMCTETDEDIARYSVLHGNEQLFATKYKLYLPSEQELREEIETQKAMFYLQQKERESAE